jgi:hypothetical protein
MAEPNAVSGHTPLCNRAIGGFIYEQCYLVRLFEWPTLDDVAVAVGRAASTVSGWTRQGKATSFETPDGIAHVDPRTVQEPQPLPEPVRTIPAAPQELGVVEQTLRAAVHRNRVRGIWVDNVLVVPKDEVLRWKQTFTTLNPGFDWLEDILRLGSRTRLLTTKQVATRLGKRHMSMPSWIIAGIFPYYVRSFGSERSPHKEIPAIYVESLVRYTRSHGLPLTPTTGQEYKRLCVSRHMLV